MLRFLFTMIGLLLFISGTSLWQQEAEVTNARFVARDLGQRSFKAESNEIERAYVALASREPSRSDWADPELGLALELDRMGFPPGFVPTPVREHRVRNSAEHLASSSPSAAAAWCVLALSEVKAEVPTAGVFEERLRSCFVFGPREISVVEMRVHLALATWSKLPKDLKTAALIDVASALQERHTRDWMLDRLAYGVAVIAPAQEATVLSLLDPYGADLEQPFQKQVLSYRQAQAGRIDRFQ
ncbi:hypothetical protein [Hyphomicrobium zavarzinii]|uniref:hypothetical protein n=1 Tax=Hyphomicrobium zavarzinii TaxID=48292 RepID=UPI0012EB0703|nr:hypothetical protein [Hyphomicrobium zavarzinii]